MKAYWFFSCMVLTVLLFFVSCTINNNSSWDGKIIVSSPHESAQSKEIIVAPNYKLELVTVLPVRDNDTMFIYSFTVGNNGFIYIGERGKYGWDDEEKKDKGYSLPRIVKIDPDGKIAGQIKGSIPAEYECIEKNEFQFMSANEIVVDSEGYLYINDYGDIYFCTPEFKTAEPINFDFNYESNRTDIEIVYNWKTGGVIVKDREKPYIELKRGKVVKNILPKYYGCDTLYYTYESNECVLAISATTGSFYNMDIVFSDDLNTIESVHWGGWKSFRLNLGRPFDSISYVGYNGNWIFEINSYLQPDQTERERLIYFLGGNTGYAGHILPQFGCSDPIMMVGEDEKYYEFGFIPGKTGLHIFRAKKIPN